MYPQWEPGLLHPLYRYVAEYFCHQQYRHQRRHMTCDRNSFGDNKVVFNISLRINSSTVCLLNMSMSILLLVLITIRKFVPEEYFFLTGNTIWCSWSFECVTYHLQIFFLKDFYELLITYFLTTGSGYSVMTK